MKSDSSHFINTILGGHTCQNKEKNTAQIGIKTVCVKINTILGGHTCQNKEKNTAQIGIKRQYVSKLEKGKS